MKKILTVLILLFSSLNLLAQNSDSEMADKLRADGKIYIVVICIVIILAGLLFYLFTLDKRLKLLEKNQLPKTNFKRIRHVFLNRNAIVFTIH